MTLRDDLKTAFLIRINWHDAQRSHLAGDASNRSYERLLRGADRAVLMDAPPTHGESIRPFTHIARHLTTHGFSAPKIYAEDPEHGFLLLEDLGDARFKETIDATPACEHRLYAAATDALIALHDCPLPQGLQRYDVRYLTQMCDLAFTHYCSPLNGPNTETLWGRFQPVFQALLAPLETDQVVLAQRDFHAENLIWLPDRSGPARVGMLDFQDAFAGHPSYDLVSLLQDARRDISPALETKMITRYITATGVDPATFEAAYWTLGVQRNIRIMGVFARLATDYGKPKYLEFMPRVWHYIQRGLSRPALAPVSHLVREALPEPTPEILRKFM